MDVMSVVSAASNLQTARIAGQIQTAVMGKALDLAEQQGQAAIDLIEAAAELMEQTTAQALEAIQPTSQAIDVQA